MATCNRIFIEVANALRVIDLMALEEKLNVYTSREASLRAQALALDDQLSMLSMLSVLENVADFALQKLRARRAELEAQRTRILSEAQNQPTFAAPFLASKQALLSEMGSVNYTLY